MVVGFDLDGTLDRPALAALCLSMIEAGHRVHVITGCFPEGDWQNTGAKRNKMVMLNIPFYEVPYIGVGRKREAQLHILTAREEYDHPTRLRELGLRKGDLCHRLGIELFFDDSEQYCELIPKMSGSTVTLKVGQ